MTPEYTVYEPNPWYMSFVGRRKYWDHTCEGCGEDFPSLADQGSQILVRVITDRSGSEQATTHNDDACLDQGIENLELEDMEDDDE